MDGNRIKSAPWFPMLLEEVQVAIAERTSSPMDVIPALEQERSDLDTKMQGWKQSFGIPDLPQALRTALHAEFAEADARCREIDAQLIELRSRQANSAAIVDPQEIISRLDRLDEVLAANNPTRANLELSLFIDRIDCDPSGQIRMRTCKLGIAPGAIDLLAENSLTVSPPATSRENGDEGKRNARRRTRLRVFGNEVDEDDLVALADFAADTERFADLPPQWFWIDDFEVPCPICWSRDNAEAVFKRKVEGKLSNATLEKEFGKSIPTIRAAIKHYLRQNPEAAGEIDMRRMVPRKPRIKIEAFADEAFQLWRAGASKVKLAENYECSPPTLDKALALGAARAGLPLARDVDRRAERIASVRTLLERGLTLPQIADEMKLSTPTIAVYLRTSFRAEGKPVPKMRRRR